MYGLNRNILMYLYYYFINIVRWEFIVFKGVLSYVYYLWVLLRKREIRLIVVKGGCFSRNCYYCIESSFSLKGNYVFIGG